ncbi:MAG: hypothetical protein J6M93_04125 [Succinivibrio sp.]|nr:hypothetical protein [Succinivibrio sp.]
MPAETAEFNNLSSRLKKAGISDETYQWYGFVLGLISKGFSPQERSIVQLCAEFLNDNQPLPGTLIAELTSISLDCKIACEEQDKDILKFPDNKQLKRYRLEALSDLAYGLTLSLPIDVKKGKMGRISDPQLLDDLRSLSEIAKVDQDSEFAEEDLSEILDFIRELIFKYYSKNRT